MSKYRGPQRRPFHHLDLDDLAGRDDFVWGENRNEEASRHRGNFTRPAGSGDAGWATKLLTFSMYFTHFHADYNEGAGSTIYSGGDKESYLMLPVIPAK